jgi:hypothetical protein
VRGYDNRIDILFRRLWHVMITKKKLFHEEKGKKRLKNQERDGWKAIKAQRKRKTTQKSAKQSPTSTLVP